MYSQAGIIVGAIVSALFGFYVFVPDGGLRNSDYWLGVWQPMPLTTSVVVTHSPSSEQKDESQFPLNLSNEEEGEEEEEEELMDENQFQFIGHDDIIQKPQAMSELHGPEISGPCIPPQVPLALMVRFHQAIVEILSFVWPHLIICLLLYLLGIVLAEKTCVLLKLQKLYQAGKDKHVEPLAGQKSKESLEKAKNRDKDEEKRPTASEQLEHEITEILNDAKANDDRVREIMFEDPSGLADSKGLPAKRRDEEEEKRPTASEQSEQPRTKTLNDNRVREITVEEDPSELPDFNGLPAKHRRPGRRNSKRDHKFEAEKRKRKQAEKKAALAGVLEEKSARV